jgi:hypothetical protein
MDVAYLRNPSDRLLELRSGWRKSKNDMYAAVQSLIVAVRRRDKGPLRGPPVWVKNFPAGSEFSIQDKKALVTKRIGELQVSIQETATTKFAGEILTKVIAEVGFTGALPTAKTLGELQAKAGVELSESVQTRLAHKRSFELDTSREITSSTTYRPSGGRPKGKPGRLLFYLELWPWRWDFYVYRVQYLQLQYKSSWLWRDVRETISETHIDLREPLFRLRFYEPQEDYSFTDEDYIPDVALEDVHAIKVEALHDPMPDVPRPIGPTLQDLARIAFPVTKAEKETARTRRVTPKKAVARKPAKPKRKAKAKSKGKAKAKAKTRAKAKPKRRATAKRSMRR